MRQKEFTAVANEWLVLHSTNIKMGTHKMYEQKVNQLTDVFRGVKINKISYIDLQNVINMMYRKGLSKSTIHKTKVTLGMIFRYALQTNIIKFNPCEFINVPKQAKTSTRTAVTDNEISIILNNVDHQFGLYPFMLLLLGLRRSELLAIHVKDIDFEKKQIRVHSVVNFNGNMPILYDGLKNGNTERCITIPNILFPFLKKFQKGEGYIFTNDKGQLLRQHQLRRLWDNYKDETGLSATQHMLRHTYATLLYKSNVDIKTAQYLMGHNDVRTMLQIYTHLSEEQKKKNIDKFDNYISDNF